MSRLDQNSAASDTAEKTKNQTEDILGDEITKVIASATQKSIRNLIEEKCKGGTCHGAIPKIWSAHLQSLHESLPNRESLKDEELGSDGIHHAPAFLIDSGARIGRVLRIGDKNPELRRTIIEFLVGCAEDREILLPVRTHCLSSALRSSLRWKEFIAVSEIRAEPALMTSAAQFSLDD